MVFLFTPTTSIARPFHLLTIILLLNNIIFCSFDRLIVTDIAVGCDAKFRSPHRSDQMTISHRLVLFLSFSFFCFVFSALLWFIFVLTQWQRERTTELWDEWCGEFCPPGRCDVAWAGALRDFDTIIFAMRCCWRAVAAPNGATLIYYNENRMLSEQYFFNFPSTERSSANDVVCGVCVIRISIINREGWANKMEI